MEKTVILNGEEITLKANAMNPVIYAGEFGDEFFDVQNNFIQAFDRKGGYDPKKIKTLEIMRLFWTMAKTANRDFPPFDEWVESLDAFPLIMLMGDIAPLIIHNVTGNSDIMAKKTEAVENEN